MNRLFKRILFFIILFVATTGANAGCSCCGAGSCASVYMGIISATNGSKSTIKSQDEMLSSMWRSELQPILIKIKDVEKIIKNHRVKMRNLKEAELVLNAKEDYLNFQINEMANRDFDVVSYEQKLLEIENQIDLVLISQQINNKSSQEVSELTKGR